MHRLSSRIVADAIVSYYSIVIARSAQYLSTFNEHYPQWTVNLAIVGYDVSLVPEQ